MGSSVLSIGVSGLNAAQMGLSVAGHNIANAATPGFSRQSIVQGTNIAVQSGSGYLGQGTNVQTVKRVYSDFLAKQVMSASTTAAELDTYSREIQQIDNLLADPSSGLSPALQTFFRGVADVAANPESLAARQSMLSSAHALVGRFQSLDSRLQDVRAGVDSQLAAAMGEANSVAGQIAVLNNRIVVAQAGNVHTPPNDLLDQRDRLLGELNQIVRTTTSTDTDGSVNVFIGNGQPLVVGSQSYRLEPAPDVFDPTRITVGYASPAGSVRLQESLVTGGKLGGLLAFRSEVLDSAQNALGRVAMGLSERFNEQHGLGQDLMGALGGTFFTSGQPLALASSQNGGGGVLSAIVTDASLLTTSEYRLSYDGANYALRRESDGQSWAGASIAALNAGIAGEGLSLTLAGAPAAGDYFRILPTRTGARDIGLAITDPRAIAAAAPIRTSAPLTNTGTASISAGSVSSVTNLATLPFTLQYDAGTGAFSGFPPALPVTVVETDGTTTNYAAGAPVTYASGATVTVGSMSFVITGQPGDQDQFTVEPNAGGVGDNRNALLLGGLQTANSLAGGTANFQSVYSQLVSEVGNKAREVDVTLVAQENLVKQASDAQSGMSGVNLDEEAANLIRYQQAYQAAAKVIQIASRLFDTLLELG